MITDVYYSHPVSEYGTEQERQHMALLAELFPAVLNPNALEHAVAYKREGWAYFDKLVLKCNACAFSLFPDGTLGAGVAKETMSFLGRKLPVYQFVGPQTLRRVFVLPGPRSLTIDETRRAVKFFSEQGRRTAKDHEPPKSTRTPSAVTL